LALDWEIYKQNVSPLAPKLREEFGVKDGHNFFPDDPLTQTIMNFPTHLLALLAHGDEDTDPKGCKRVLNHYCYQKYLDGQKLFRAKGMNDFM